MFIIVCRLFSGKDPAGHELPHPDAHADATLSTYT
jgi:hypothetical protein